MATPFEVRGENGNLRTETRNRNPPKRRWLRAAEVVAWVVGGLVVTQETHGKEGRTPQPEDMS